MTRLSKLSGGEGSQPLDKCLFSFIVAGIQNKVNFPFPTPPPPGKKKPNTWFASSVGSWHKCDRKRSRDSVSAVKGSITIMSRETVLAVKYLIVLQKLRRLKNFNRLFLYRKAGFVLWQCVDVTICVRHLFHRNRSLNFPGLFVKGR